ncbi:MAG: hypothetical protein JO356_15515 [Acidobacteria bacterium]|nr:hypothetical protein [Acidobacteriota bacterium]
MKFAKIVFWVAGVWGVLVIAPLFFIFDLIGRQDPPPLTHPGFYYGFASTAMAWQVAFFVIARDPLRFRSFIVPSIIEKFGYGTTLIVLFIERRIRPGDLAFASADLLLGFLFLAAYYKTRSPATEP